MWPVQILGKFSMASPITDVKSLYQLIVSSKLMTDAELREAWTKASAEGVTTPEAFATWLLSKGKLTKYHAESLLRGNRTFFLDDYKLVDRIGQGRMAGVYRAQHKLGMSVAVKVLPPSRAKDAHCLARFQREASLALKMDHPRVVKTFHAGSAAGLHYIAMELLDGETLDERLDRKKTLPIPEVLRLAQQILEGLQHMADRNVVHRDLKPSNLMLQTLPGHSSDDGFYAVKLLDIGLGREMFDESSDGGQNAELTAAGTTLGTPNYMSPEQCRNASSADIRSDLYSLGCLLYECIAGRVPFTEKNIVQKLTKHATEMPPVPDYGSTPVAEQLHRFLWKLLAKKPTDRFQTPNEALREVQSLLKAATTAPAPTVIPVATARLLTPSTPAPIEVDAEPIDVTLATDPEPSSGFSTLLWVAGIVLVLIMASAIGAFVVLGGKLQ